jgi:hypothetical protein
MAISAVREEVPDGGVCSVKAKNLLVAVSCITFLLPVDLVLGDGSMFPRHASYADIRQPTQKVYIRWDGAQEKLLVQTKYQGPAEEMVWIVPVPAEPTVEKGDSHIFEALSLETSDPDISLTPLAGLLWSPYPPGPSMGISAAPVVEWRRRIGEYDVVLLRPEGEENVIRWLNSNDFAVPDKAVPILQDYIRDGWWMVAAKIDPNALTDITRNKLAEGLLHPLEMTFQSHACLYPLRLTSLAAGPVQELIYIEGPTHYEPATFADPNWQIDVFGGPLRLVPDGFRLPDVGSTLDIIAGRTITIPQKHLTKLRRTFQPSEMTQDIIFGKMDYAKLAASEDPVRIAQAATQCGRHRDPNGVSHLSSALRLETLKQLRQQAMRSFPTFEAADEAWDAYERVFQQVRSCIWALGEIAIEHRIDAETEEAILQCAQYDDNLVRMDAYIALMKLGSERLGPILTDRFAQIVGESSLPVTEYYPEYIYWSNRGVQGEMDIVADWIWRFGTITQKDTIIGDLQELIPTVLSNLAQYGGAAERRAPTAFGGGEYVICRAARTQDQRLIPALQDARSQLAGANTWTLDFLLRAEAACGSTVASDAVLRSILKAEREIVPQGQATPVGNITPLNYNYEDAMSLRERVLWKRDALYQLYPLSPAMSDATIRSALSAGTCCPWYTLYLLAEIKEPQVADRERLLKMWDGSDVPTSLVAVDVLYAWGDGPTLVSLYAQTPAAEVKSEIAWALAQLGIPEAAAIVEEQLRSTWNPEWLATGWPFPRLVYPTNTLTDAKAIDAVRTAEAAWSYFHPEFDTVSNELLFLEVLRPEILDAERLELLQRLAADNTIHAGMRFDLIGSDYATTEWAKPLIGEAAGAALQSYPSASTVNIILPATNTDLVIDACGQFMSDKSRRDLLISLLASGNGYFLPVLEGLLWQVWAQRYDETQSQSILFREPGNLAASMDYYCAHCTRRPYTAKAEPVLQAIVNDDSLPAGYRAFLLVYWPTAPGFFSKEFVEDLLQEDMPDFIREALQRRLLDWHYSL